MATKKDIMLVLGFKDDGSAVVKKVVSLVKKELDKTGKSAQKFGKDFDAMKRQVDGAAKSQSKFGKMMKSTGGQMLAAMGTMMGVQAAIRGIQKVITSTIQAGREFEREWANTTTMLTTSAQETEKLRNELLTLSPALGDTTDLARGMYQVLSASVEPAKAIQFLGVAAMSAKAGVTDTTTAVDALTTVINAYGMQAEDVTKVSDIMFQAVKRGKLTYAGLSGALGTVVPMAAKVGLGFEEVAAAMASLTRQGINVNTTSVQLRGILVSVLKPTSQAKTMAKKLGLEFNATALRAKGLSGFLADVTEKTKGNNESLTQLFGNVRALTGVMGLAGEGAKGFTKDLALMKNASGSTQTAFEKQMKSADFMINMFKTALNKLQIAFYQGITKSFSDGIKSQADFERKISDLIKKVREFGEGIVKVGTTLKHFFDIMSEGGSVLTAFGNQITENIIKFLGLASMEDIVADATIKAQNNVKDFTDSLILLTIEQEVLDKMFTKGGSALDEWKKKMRETDVQMAKSKDPYFGLTGAIQKQAEALREQVSWILESSKTSEEASKRIDYYRKSMEGATKAVENSAIAEKLGLKTKFELGVKLQDLVKDIDAARASGLVYDVQLQGLAKQAVALAKITGTKLSPAIVKLAEDMKKADEKTKAVAGSINAFTTAAVIAAKAIIEMQKATSLIGKTIPQLELELTALIEAYETYGQLLTSQDQVAAVAKIVAAYQHLGKEVPLHYQLIMATSRKAAVVLVQDAEKVESAIIKRLGGALKGAGKLFAVLGADVGGFAGDVIGAIGGLAETIGNSWEDITEDGSVNFEKLARAATQMAGQVGGAIGGMISGIEDNFGALGASIGSTIGGILGPIGGAIGGLLGGIIGGLFGQAESAAERAARLAEEHLAALVDNVKAATSEFGELSDALAETIAESALEMEGFAAISKHFGEIIADVGVNQENINGLWLRATDIIHQTTQGYLTAEEGIASLNSSFEQLLAGAQKFGTEGSAAMVEFINKVKASGLEVAAVTDYINEQLGVVGESSMSAAQGLEAMAAHVGNSEAAMARLENQTLAVYNAMIANGATASQAMESLGGTLDAIIAKHKEMGTEASAAIQALSGIREIITDNQELMSAIEGNIAVMTALANTGSMTQETFDSSAQSAKQYHRQLLKAGMDGDQALARMAPTLEQLAYLAQEHGYELDNNTQKLYDEAVAAGHIAEQQLSTNDIMMAGLGAIIEALGGDIPEAFRGAMDDMAEFGNAGRTAAADIGNAGTGAFEDIANAANEELGNIENDINGLQGHLDGLRAPSLYVDIDSNLGELERQLGGLDRGYTSPLPGGRRGGETHAQEGYHGVVTEREQRFVAHRGEEVDIWRRGETRETREENINVFIEPVVIEKNNEYVIDFVTKKIERGGIRIPLRAVRGE